MFGYATDETEECMPLTIILAHKLNAKMAELRRNGSLPWLRPDSKTQVSVDVDFMPFFKNYYYFLNRFRFQRKSGFLRKEGEAIKDVSWKVMCFASGNFFFVET